jgi:hypothetical protein
MDVRVQSSTRKMIKAFEAVIECYNNCALLYA